MKIPKTIIAYYCENEPGLFKPVCIAARNAYGMSVNVYFVGTTDEDTEIVGVTVYDNEGERVGAVGLVPATDD